MIRTQLLEELTRVLGQPRGGPEYTEWLVETPRDVLREWRCIRVCVNRKLLLKDLVHPR
jgi:hypothetical protein